MNSRTSSAIPNFTFEKRSRRRPARDRGGRAVDGFVVIEGIGFFGLPATPEEADSGVDGEATRGESREPPVTSRGGPVSGSVAWNPC